MTCRAGRTLELTGVGGVEGERGRDGAVPQFSGVSHQVEKHSERGIHLWEQGPEGPQLWIYWPFLLVRTQVSKPWPMGQI